MERVYEDHENLVENCLMWKVDSKNTLWFIERPEKYDVFVKPERYINQIKIIQIGTNYLHIQMFQICANLSKLFSEIDQINEKKCSN